MPNPCDLNPRYGAEIARYRKPVIRAYRALLGETPVEVVVRRLPGSGLCVFQSLRRDSYYLMLLWVNEEI